MKSSMHSKDLIIGPLTITADILALEYSHSQKAFHVQPLVDSIYSNLLAFGSNRPSDYILIGIFPNYEELDKFQAKWIKRLKNNGPDLSNLTIDDLLGA